MAVCIKDCIQNMNLVIGCTIGCSYCYARNNVRRFHMIDDFEKPEFFPNKLRLMEKKRPQNFLLTGMSDFAHWNPEWRNQIFSKMAENPQHQYLFLTKRPEDIVFSTTLENAWFGVTVTSSKEKDRIQALREHIVCVAIYAVLVQNIALVDDIIYAIWTCMGYTVLLCFCLFKTSSLAKSVFNAH